jgi:hypothetical protein
MYDSTGTKGENRLPKKTKITANVKKIAHCLYFYELVHRNKNLYYSLIIFLVESQTNIILNTLFLASESAKLPSLNTFVKP